jgi:glycerol uptake facilitator-like aquaporin
MSASVKENIEPELRCTLGPGHQPLPERLFMERLIFILGCLATTMEAHMKLTLPGILITALIVASPTAFAQGTYSGTSSNPATSVAKDDSASMTKQSKKHMASHKKKHHAKHKSSKAQTTGSGTRY